jgi:MFS transporter, ACS family, tartrate transporter
VILRGTPSRFIPETNMPNTPSSEQAIVHKIWWRIVPFLTVLLMMNFLDRSNVGFAALSMNSALNFSPEIYGTGVSFFFVGYLAMVMPSNAIVYRVGARVWLPLIAVLWGLVSMLTALVEGKSGFYATRLFLGVAEAGFQPGVLFFLTLWFPDRYRASATAAFMSAGTVTGIIGSPISGALLSLDGWMGVAGWQWLFILEGIPSMLLGFAAFFCLSDGPEKASWLSDEEKKVLGDALGRDAQARHEAEQVVTMGVNQNRDMWLLAGSYFLIGIAVWSLLFWLPQIIKQVSKVSNFETGLLTSIPYLVATIALILIARSSDRRGERRWHVAGTLLTGAVGLALAGSTSVPWISLVGLSLGAIGVFSFIGPFWALVSSRVAPALRARVIGAITCGALVGGFMGPYFVGWLREATGNFAAGLFGCGAVMAAASLLIALTRADGASGAAAGAVAGVEGRYAR